jgi:hypothetical protein
MSTIRYVETDALAALREELMGAATRRAASRRKRRRALTLAAIAAALLALAGGAVAISHFSTGVDPVDRLLEVDNYGGSALPGGGATEPIAVRMGDGTYQMVAYLNRRGEVSIASAEEHRGGVRGSSSGGGLPAAELGRRLERRGTLLQGSSHGTDSRVYWGYADGSVESARVTAPEGDWSVKLSKPWTPAVQGARPLRLLVAIDERDVDESEITIGMPKLEPVYAK